LETRKMPVSELLGHSRLLPPPPEGGEEAGLGMLGPRGSVS